MAEERDSKAQRVPPGSRIRGTGGEVNHHHGGMGRWRAAVDQIALQGINKKSAKVGGGTFGPDVVDFGATSEGSTELGSGNGSERGQVLPNDGQRVGIGDVDGKVFGADATAKGSVTRHSDNNGTGWCPRIKLASLSRGKTRLSTGAE